MIRVSSTGQSVPVHVIVNQSTTTTRFDILPSGQCVLVTTPEMAAIGRETLRSHLFRYIDAFFNPLPPDVYIRVTHYKEDYEHLAEGAHRGSINHATGEPEGGLSVAVHPEFPARYAYYVKGRVIGQGTDGEPLLDLTTARPASRLLTWRQFQADYNRKLARKVTALGLTMEEYRLLVSSARLIF